jgi:predicted amidohydrolase
VTSGVPAADSQWGHSLAVSPMGQVVASAEIDETIVHVALGRYCTATP